MQVFTLFHLSRWETERLTGIYAYEEEARAAGDQELSRFNGSSRWSRVRNRSHDLGMCLRGVRLRAQPFQRKMFEEDTATGKSYAYPFMVAVVPKVVIGFDDLALLEGIRGNEIVEDCVEAKEALRRLKKAMGQFWVKIKDDHPLLAAELNVAVAVATHKDTA